MKFFNFYFCLIIAISSYAHNINIKRNISLDEDALWEGISKECDEELENTEYSECMTKVTLNNYKQFCPAIKTEKCQKFYENPMNYLPACKNEPKIEELFQSTFMEMSKISYELECALDENGDLCPIAMAMILKDSGNEILEDTCKSKACTDTAIKVYKGFTVDNLSNLQELSFTGGSFSYNEITSMSKLVKALESDKCKSQHVKSNASNIKTNTSLLFSLLLLLLLLLF